MPYIEWRGNSCRVKWWNGEYTASGKKRYESASGFVSEAEAYDYGLDRESDVRNLRHVTRQSGRIAVKQWSLTWLATLDLDPTSVNHYRKVLRAQVWPRWGATPLVEITTHQYKAWKNQIEANYSANYARDILKVFGMLMDDAVDHVPPLISVSPVPKVNKRRGRYKPKPREKKNVVLTADIHRLAENARVVWGQTGYVFMLTAGYTGMRLGELFGLRREFCHPLWPASDPDPERREEGLLRYGGDDPMPAIRVQWQHKYLKDPANLDAQGVPHFAPPKYGSERTLVIPPFLAELLEQHLASHDSEHVFPALTGGPLLTTDFNTYYWKPIRDGADARVGRYSREKVKPVEVFAGKRIHLIRHAHKAHMDEDGHPRVVVEERQGHRLQGVEGVYSQVTPTMERRVMQCLQARWLTEEGTREGRG